MSNQEYLRCLGVLRSNISNLEHLAGQGVFKSINWSIKVYLGVLSQ